MAYTRQDRKVAMLRSGKSGAEIARELGCTETLVSLVIAGKRTSGPKAREVMEHLSLLWGLPIEYIWPGVMAGTHQ